MSIRILFPLTNISLSSERRRKKKKKKTKNEKTRMQRKGTPKANLYTFLESRGSESDRAAFTDGWSFYLRNVLGIAKESRHVWPYNPDFALKSGLVRVGRQLFGEAADTNASRNERTARMTLDDFERWFDTGESISGVDAQDIPGTVRDAINNGSLTDPLSFPDDSQIYRSWKAISAAIETIDQGGSNIELQTRRVQRQNNTLARDIERLGRVIYVQDQFVSKFSLNDEEGGRGDNSFAVS